MTTQRELTAKTGALIFVFILTLCFGQCFSLAAEGSNSELRIGSIEIAGNVTIIKATILASVRARVGELYNKASANEDSKRIAQIEGVEYAYYNTKVAGGQVELTFVVVEKNLVRAIVFNGNKKVKVGKLSKDLGFKKGDYLDIFLARAGVEVLGELYRKAGYPSAEIRLDESALKAGRVIYNIKEGLRARIQKVLFDGNETIPTKELKKAIKTRSRKFWFWPAYYVEQTASEDVTKLQEAYQKRGYLNARVTSRTNFSEDGKFVEVTFVIGEGPVYTMDEIVIAGNEFFDAETLRKGLKLKAGEIYSKEKADFDAKGILNRYREQGFVDAEVKYNRRFVETLKVAAEFIITEGERFRIGQVIITGNESTHDKVVRRILDEENFKPGQWYNSDLARGDGQGELEKIIRQTVMTESAFIKPVGTAPGQRNAHVNIVEGQTGSIMLGAGVASDSGVIGQLVFDQRNFDIGAWPDNLKDIFVGDAFKGAGQRLRIALEPGTVQSRYSVSFTERYLYDKPISLDVAGSSFERGREAYDEERIKVYLGFEKRYKNKWRRGISFRAERVDVVGLEPDAPKEIVDVKGSNDLVGIRAFVRKDTTDSRFNPSKGYNFNAGYEQVGGDHTFGVLSGTQRWYKTLHEDLAERKTILETKLYAATIVGNAPPFEKFCAGGTGSLRGFDYRGVSTRGLQTNVVNPEHKDPIGSDWIMVANAEIAVPLTTEVLSWLFFVDTGVIDTGGVRASVGTGIQIMIPQWFGPVPMRFELATPFIKDGDDETRVFSFSVGALF